MTNLSAQAIRKTIELLSEPRVKYRVELASTTEVAKDIIDALPGVKQLKENGPEAAKVVLALLQDEKTLQDENLTAISLRILENYPSDDVKVTLAKPIVARKFLGFNSQLAAETFLKAVGIEALRKDAIAVALREARKLVKKSPKSRNKKEQMRNPVRVDRKKVLSE
jgi:hypothetical protein